MKATTIVFIAVSVLSLIALCLEFFAPSPIKEISGGYVIIFIASMIVYRAVEVFTSSERANAALPYIAATFLVLVPIGFLASKEIAVIAWGTIFVIIGIATFYWIVNIIIDSFKKEFFKKH
jgi:hypothetical protein